MDAYATHLEALVTTAMNTSGGILELGCGDYSTPILMAIAKAQGREYKCQSSTPEWAKRFKGVEIVEDWEEWKPEGQWGMVFMDSDEKTWNRMKRIPLLKGHTNTIVIHDADVCMQREAWPKAAEAFPDITIYNTYKPWTAVMRC
jgi:hypothetical protein